MLMDGLYHISGKKRLLICVGTPAVFVGYACACACAGVAAQVHEDDISAVLEEACDPSKLSGRWITQYDIVEVG